MLWHFQQGQRSIKSGWRHFLPKKSIFKKWLQDFVWEFGRGRKSDRFCVKGVRVGCTYTTYVLVEQEIRTASNEAINMKFIANNAHNQFMKCNYGNQLIWSYHQWLMTSCFPWRSSWWFTSFSPCCHCGSYDQEHKIHKWEANEESKRATDSSYNAAKVIDNEFFVHPYFCSYELDPDAFGVLLCL